MSDSTDNTNELDSYGVWVKNTNQDEGTDEGLNFADSLDLPDFEETDNISDSDFSDMFSDDNSVNLDASSDDTTLTDDELLNITSGEGIEIAPAEDASADDSINEVDFSTEIGDDFEVEDNPLDEVSFDSLEENSVSDSDLADFASSSEEIPSEDVAIEEPVTEPAEDATLDDFDFGDFAEETVEETVDDTTDVPVEETVEESEPESEEISMEDFATEDASEDFGIESSESEGEEEISLDDFMDNGFSNESVASGNNGFAADAVPSGSSEEVSLDDFVDMSEFGVTEEAPKKEETITDEKPLDMDISFDSSADTIQTEENLEAEDALDDDFQEEAAVTEEETENVDASSFGNDIEAEEVDLSDFGIDADAEETPVTQDVEGAKTKEAIVDYDLSVDDGNMNAAPVVNEIKTPAAEESVAAIAETIEESEPVEAAPAVSAADSSLLQQIVADLSSLKEEINTLKNNLEEIKAAPAPVAADSSNFISEEIAIEDNTDEAAKEDTGFFSGDDGDDTIALSTDELSNILNTADFSSADETITEEAPADDFASEDTFVEETPAEEPAAEEFVVEEEVPAEEPVEEESVEEEVAVDDFEVTEEAPATEDFAVKEETVVEEEPATDDFALSEDEPIGEPVSEESLGFIQENAGSQEDLTFDFNDDNLSEPNLDEIEIDEEDLNDDLPEEISIPKEDDIFVESSSSDFMDSVQDTTEEHELEQEQAQETEPAVQEEEFSTVDNLFEEEKPDSEISEVSDFMVEPEEETVVEEQPVEETIVEEPVVEEEPVIEPEVPAEEETFVSEEEVVEEEPAAMPEAPFIENDFISHEDDNNNLTDSNIDYLTTEDKDEITEVDENAELKKDIKSVLLYMDQLLENLPEEKIVEFAKSDEFTTYKKLFSELGLS